MPLTFFLLHMGNVALAAASAWIYYRNPNFMDDQAIFFSVVVGSVLSWLTAIITGLALVFSNNIKWKSATLNVLLTLGFAAFQGYFLYLTSREVGLLQLLKSKLG